MVETYNELRKKTEPNLTKLNLTETNSYVAEKRIVSKLSKISIPNCDSTYWRLEWRLRLYFLYTQGRKGEGEGQGEGEYGRVWGEEEENADNGGMMKPSQHHVASCVKGVEWGLDTIIHY